MMIGTGRLLRRYATCLALLLAIQAVLLPIYGPWLDQHFGERLPQHNHIYLGRIDLDHHDGSDSDVVSLPNLDATDQAFGYLLPPYSPPPGTPLWGNSGLTFSIVQETLPSQGTFLPPPDAPPRV